MASLVIVESPAKAKTINKYLGKDFIVKSSVGHIRDLPVTSSQVKKTGSKISTFDRMGIYPDQDWAAHYQVLPGKEKVVEELRKLAAKADEVYLATDLDREGEAIAWHLKELLVDKNPNFRRVIFNEITKSAIQKAFENPGKLDTQRVEAQQARRFLDRIVGFMVSPLLWKRVARGLSAGRVQSVAVKLIVEREREIQQFIPKEYWRIFADTLHSDTKVNFELNKYKGKKFACDNAEDAAKHKQFLDTAELRVSNCQVKPTTGKPPPPFITSSLQQAASSQLGFAVKRTMQAAQRLYEAGWITYMRTDSTFIGADALQQARDAIAATHGDAYLPEEPRFYASKKNAQEAHEAIRPSDVNVDASQLDAATADGKKLYALIWRRFIASQMTDAKYQNTTVTIAPGDYQLEAKGRVMLFDGFTKVLGKVKDKDVVELPAFSVGDMPKLERIDTKQLFTKPPARYAEASLVRELEKRGIGRPSTYASIISTILDRGYVFMRNKRMHAEKMGEIVTTLLDSSFEDFMDYDFTAKMENKLDKIASGDLVWKELLNDFYSDLTRRLEAEGTKTEHANPPIPTDTVCEKCQGQMQIRHSKNGVFLGCSNYSKTGDEKCTNTKNLIDCTDIAEDVDEDEDVLSAQLRERKRCPICSMSMIPYLIDNNTKLHICSNSPMCIGQTAEQGEFLIKKTNESAYRCHKCESPLELKSGRFGKFFACSNEECGATRGILANGQPAPPKMTPIPMPELKCVRAEDHFVLRDGATGLFLAASSFPKHRETRPVKIAELQSHKSELEEKYHYLLSAPLEDPQGNATIARYSRKAASIYVGSEKEGKATKWNCQYKDGLWHQPTK